MDNKQDDILEYDLKDIQAEDNPNVNYLDSDLLIAPLKGQQGSSQPVRSNMYTVVTCVRGYMQLTLNGTAYTLHRGDLLFCLPNIIISGEEQSADFEGGLLCMTNRLVQGLLGPHVTVWNHALYVRRQWMYHIDLDRGDSVVGYTSVLKSRMDDHQNPYREQIVQSVLRAILFEICSHMRENVPSAGSGPVMQAERIFNRFLDVLAAEKTKKRPVYYYADRLCISSKYLSVVCKQMSDRTASDWIESYLGEDIRYYLRNTDKPLKEVCEILNFPNLSFFGKYVKSHFGCTPSQMRCKER